MVVCHARRAASPASYRAFSEGGRVWVALVMADRWLSESIEADLLHTGDKIEDLVHEELIELGYNGPRPAIEHFRSDDLLFTFRTPIAGDDPRDVTRCLLAYEAAFRNLGDMDTGG
jgi:hypothetical protein